MTADVSSGAVMLAKPGLFNCVRILFAALIGYRVFLLDTNTRRPFERALFPGMKFVRHALLRFRNISDANELDARLTQSTEYRAILLLSDIFGQIEDWQSDYFDFDDIDQKLPEFAECYRAVICSEMEFRQFEIFAAECAAKRYPGARLVFSGIDTSTQGAVGALESMTDVRLPAMSEVRAIWINRIRNLIVFPALIALHFARLIRLTRLTAPAREDVFMMVDYVADEDDNKFYEAGHELGSVVLVPRTPGTKIGRLPQGLDHGVRHRRDGVLPLSKLFISAGYCWRNSLSIYRYLGGLDLQKFAVSISWPFKVVEFEAFFLRGRPKVFFARDCYNYDHILRHQVLSKIGVIHIGLNVGYPCYSILFPTTRYISFDYFFVYGAGLYEKHYSSKWPSRMEIVPIGPFRVGEELFEDARRGNDSGDIAVFAGPFVHETAMIQFVRDLAQTLPERKILLQVKQFFRNSPSGQVYIQRCTEDRPNVVPVNDNVYDILSQVTYSVTDPSSILVEAMSLGRISFLADVSSRQRSCYFRDFDDIVLHSGQEAGQRIEALETGSEAYPWQDLENVAYLSDDYFMHRVRARLQQINRAERRAS